MSIEVTPLGVTCNLACTYCYQEPMRDAGNFGATYDMAAMKRGLDAEGYRFTVFGGEPLLVPFPDLEELLRYGHERWGGSSIQTNGTLLTPEHIEMFARWNVGVGISCDGPADLSDARWAGDADKTRRMTERTLEAIRALSEAGRYPSLIVTLHRGNARPEVRPRLKAWLREMASIGVRHVRLHVLEVDSALTGETLAFSPEENTECLLDFAAWEAESGCAFDITSDIRKLLAASDGNDSGVTCVWNACDPYTTRAVRGVDGKGQRTNCGRTNKDGVSWRKAEAEGFERYLALYQTPQEYGGCQGCRFWLICKGQCPGMAIDGDWRNRTRDCSTWFALMERAEAEAVARGEVPVSLRPDRERMERAMYEAWSAGRYMSIAGASHQDTGCRGDPHSDTPHLDTPHIDWYGTPPEEARS